MAGLDRLDAPHTFTFCAPLRYLSTGMPEAQKLLKTLGTGAREARLDRELGSYYGEMYPAILRLAGGRLLLTFTVRAVRPPLGVQAVLGRERHDGFEFDFDHDRLVLDARTPPNKPSGGGFGNTVPIADGAFVTSYSYRGADDQTHVEVVRWKLPEQ